MINTNVRAIKIHDNGLYKISVDRSLCTHCGRQQSCEAFKANNRMNKKYSVVSLVKECAEYTYPIVFQDEQGTEGKFNTIRLGEAWSKRLKAGDRVALVNKTGETFGFATVIVLQNGDKNEILQNHAYKNHLYLNKKMSKEEAGKHLIKRLPSIYGNLIASNNDKATVIYLES